MKHRKKGIPTFGRRKAHRKEMLYNMAAQLIINKRIKTTHRKAKEVQKISEKLISIGKEDSVHSRRRAFKILSSRDLVKKLFDDIAPKYMKRNGGYTRVVKVGHRRGDAAPISILEYIEDNE